MRISKYLVSLPGVRAVIRATRLSIIRRAFAAETPSQELVIPVPQSWYADKSFAPMDEVNRDFAQEFAGQVDWVKELRARFVGEAAVAATLTGLEIVEMGCGRGEYLELLESAGVRAVGVDMSAVLVDELSARGLVAQCADANSYLEHSADSALGGVVSFNVVEHMQPEYLLRFLQLCGRKVASGGCLILHTSNVENAFESGVFWVDPTHVRPYHPQMVAFYASRCGFRDVRIVYYVPAEMPIRLTGEDSSLYRAFAVVGVRRQASCLEGTGAAK